MKIHVHPDVVAVAHLAIEALQNAERLIGEKGYHLGQSVLQLCIDDQVVASIEWSESNDAWCLAQEAAAP